MTIDTSGPQIAALAFLLSAMPAFAAPAIAPDTSLGTSEAQVRVSLKTMGAKIEELDSGQGVIEAQYSIDEKSHEVRVDATTGKVVSIDAKGDDEGGDE